MGVLMAQITEYLMTAKFALSISLKHGLLKRQRYDRFRVNSRIWS